MAASIDRPSDDTTVDHGAVAAARSRPGGRRQDSEWAPERRRAASEAARARWVATPRDVRQARLERGWRTYVARYPERAAAYSVIYQAVRAGEIERQPCEDCGSDKAVPFLDRTSHILIGWRCRVCRRRADSA